jgi:hypothetical protein
MACTRQDEPPASTSTAVASSTTSTRSVVAQPTISSAAPIADSVGNESWRQQPLDPKYLTLVIRRTPDSILDLPRPVVETLKKRDCMIPQGGPTVVSNAVSGAFTRKGVVEWAVVCSVRDTSRVLILNETTGAVVDSLEKTPDLPFIESEDGKLWVLGETVTVESAETLNAEQNSTDENRTDYAKVFPSPIDHDGVGHWFTDKGGYVSYSANGKWYRVYIGD